MMTREEFETFDTSAVENPYDEIEFEMLWGDFQPSHGFVDLYCENGWGIRHEAMLFFREEGSRRSDVRQLGRIWWSDAVANEINADV